MIKIAFYGDEITFNGISCTDFGLGMFSENSNEKITVSNYKSDMTKPYKQNKFLPKKQYEDEPNYINISLFPLDGEPITRTELNDIEKWLHPDSEFKSLTINQEDMDGWHYNCRLQSMEAETFGNKIMMIHLVFEADSVYVWSDELTSTYTITTTPQNCVFNNISSEDSLRPRYVIKMNASGGSATITNNAFTDINQKTMAFTLLQANEIITVDTELCIVSSNLRNGVFSNFTYPNFMRLPYGSHTFVVDGNVAEFKIVYFNAKRVGD